MHSGVSAVLLVASVGYICGGEREWCVCVRACVRVCVCVCVYCNV